MSDSMKEKVTILNPCPLPKDNNKKKSHTSICSRVSCSLEFNSLRIKKEKEKRQGWQTVNRNIKQQKCWFIVKHK